MRVNIISLVALATTVAGMGILPMGNIKSI